MSPWRKVSPSMVLVSGRMSTTVTGMKLRTCATNPSIRDPTSTCSAGRAA
uniref:Uncharacterized protein n=1 Tax=uncultured bacterium 259 TaxID=698386 RepID=E3T6Q7_9BACT|nr:hypothetical protein [uncultured bacterium 259]